MDIPQHVVSKHPEGRESLWFVILSPTIWAAHFLASYLTAAIWCAKYAPADGSLGPVRTAIGIYTLVALILIGVVGWGGFRRHLLANRRVPHDRDTAEDRTRFLGYATFLLSLLSAVATVFVSLSALYIGNCD